MGLYKRLQNLSNCIHTESFYPMGRVTFGLACIIHSGHVMSVAQS
jgi:hypothetical protein